VYGAYIASTENMREAKRIRVRKREGQTRREAEAHSLKASYVWEVAGFLNSSGGAAKLRHQREDA
jgi:hypothetical protein